MAAANQSTKRSSDQRALKSYNESNGEAEDKHNDTLCGSCGGNYSADEFCICWEVCERWFHGKCVRITPAKAENMKQYKCSACSSERSRQSHSRPFLYDV